MIGAFIFLGIYILLCLIAITPIVLLAYAHFTGNMKPFYKFYATLTGTKYE